MTSSASLEGCRPQRLGLHPSRAAARPPQDEANRQAISFSRRVFVRVRVLTKRFARTSQSKKGGGAPTGASIYCPRHTSACCHTKMLRARKRATLADVAT